MPIGFNLLSSLFFLSAWWYSSELKVVFNIYFLHFTARSSLTFLTRNETLYFSLIWTIISLEVSKISELNIVCDNSKHNYCQNNKIKEWNND